MAFDLETPSGAGGPHDDSSHTDGPNEKPAGTASAIATHAGNAAAHHSPANDHPQDHNDTHHTDGPNSKPGHTHSHDTDLTGVSADDHHTENHADSKHTTHPTHAQLGSIGTDDHHAQAHTLASHSSKAHSELAGVGANDHHSQSHPDTDHSTHPAHASLVSVGPNDHHNETHDSSKHSDVVLLAAGPPTTGTHAQYDIARDLTGQEWICVSAGTPGTWVAVGSGQQLYIAKTTATFDIKAVGTTETDVTNLACPVPATSRPFKLHTYLTLANASGTAAANSLVQVMVVITDNSNNRLGYGSDTHVAITTTSSTRRSIIDVWTEEQAPISSTTTYKVRVFTSAAVPANWGNIQFQAAYLLTPAKPYYLEAISC